MSFKGRSAASIASQKQYFKLHKEQFSLVFNKEKDKDIIEKLDSMDNWTDYIRTLIRQDMEREKKENEKHN